MTIEPSSGVITAASRRMIVVLPAPSGPTKPNTSPLAQSSVSRSTAATPPKRLVRLRTSMTGFAGSLMTGRAPARGFWRRPAGREPVRATDCRCRCGCDRRASPARRGSRRSSGVNSAASEMNEMRPGYSLPGIGVGGDRHLLAEPDLADVGLVDVGAQPDVVDVGEGDDRRARATRLRRARPGAPE